MTSSWSRTARRTGTYLGGALVLLALLGCLVWFGGRWAMTLSVAEYEGSRTVEGLDHPLEITFDSLGIPQVWAETTRDLYFALGWLHASERLFQMELVRRVASGSLSEVFGADAFDTDLRQRQIGFRRLAERVQPELDPVALERLEGYAAGVNERIERTRLLPPEFLVLRFRPEPWTLLDVLTVFVYQTWYPTELAGRGDVHAELVERLGPEAAELLGSYKPWSSPSAPDAVPGGAADGPSRIGLRGVGWDATSPVRGPLKRLFEDDAFPFRMLTATNNWAVAPERSVSGRALHAADPHLVANAVPGFWYIVGLHSAEGREALGITVPGVPVVAMGHNGQIAWSFSVAPMLLVDHYIERFHPTDSMRVRTPEGYASLETWQEAIQVRGEEEPRKVSIYRTPRGVLLERNGRSGRSMHWSGYDHIDGEAVSAALGLPDATDFESFRGSASSLRSLSVNWIYSDRDGNIGYQLGAAVPSRSYDPFQPQSADDPEVRWEGYHAPDMSPSAHNPEQGWLATTNNQPAPEDWPVDIPGHYDLFRIARVEAWMDRQERFDRSDMEQMQLDVVSAQALARRELMALGAEGIDRDELASRIRAWDGSMTVDDALPTLFTHWWRELGRQIFEDRLGEAWPRGAVLREIVLTEGIDRFIEDHRTPESETPEVLAARALADALELWNEQPFGEVQTLTIRHPLSQAPLLNRWLRLDRGPFPRGGDAASLNVAASIYRPETGRFEVQLAPSMRYVLDWSDVDGFTIEIPMGQSGNPSSPHYDDFLELNRRGDRWVVPFSREGVEARGVRLLRLEPAPTSRE